MSYYTQRHIVADSDSFIFAEDVVDKYFDGEVLSLMDDNCIRGTVQWRSDIEDMKKISADYPNTLFIMHNQGEEMDDLWVAYFKGGKAQVETAVITYGEFDESKLKE